MKILQISLFIMVLCIMASALQAQSVEMRRLDSFSKIQSGGSWNLILQKGDFPEVKIEAKNVDLDRVISEVQNETLKIYLEKGNYRNIDLTVYVTYVELEGIKTSGSGNIKCLTDLSASDLEIVMSGSGDARFNNLMAANLQVTMSGSGHMNISGGSVGKLVVKQSGSGNFFGENLHTEEADINKSGSGNVTLAVNQSLSVRSSGSGNVQYKGNPEHNDVRISGSGRVVKN